MVEIKKENDVGEEYNIWTLAKGKWRNILGKAGVPSKFLRPNVGQSCPMCGGKDRYTFTDYEGDGNYFCRGCGAGNGVHLLSKPNRKII